jgi:hypothetical protein
MYCEICGSECIGKCRNTKLHNKIKALAKSYGNMAYDAICKNEEFKCEAYHDKNEAEKTGDVDAYIEASKRLMFAYYMRFLKAFNGNTTITLDTYSGMVLKSRPKNFNAFPEAYETLVREFGLIYGLHTGGTYVLAHEHMRIIENSLFLAYTDVAPNSWTIQFKQTGETVDIPFKKLQKSSSNDFVMGYVKCLAHTKGWLD